MNLKNKLVRLKISVDDHETENHSHKGGSFESIAQFKEDSSAEDAVFYVLNLKRENAKSLKGFIIDSLNSIIKSDKILNYFLTLEIEGFCCSIELKRGQCEDNDLLPTIICLYIMSMNTSYNTMKRVFAEIQQGPNCVFARTGC